MDQFQDMVVSPKQGRHFLSADINFDSWQLVKPWYENLKNRPLNSVDDLHQWLLDLSELESAVSEHLGWLYITMTCNTQDRNAADAYRNFVTNIQPLISEYEDELNRKLIACTYHKQLSGDYKIHIASVENQIKIFRKENIPLVAELTVKEQQYGEIAGEMTVEVEGKTLTLQQASNYLKRQDGKLREEVYFKIGNRRLQDREKLDSLFNELVQLRHKIALNAGFKNYRDYKFV